MSDLVGVEPFPLESLTSYVRRAARGRFFTDTVSFLRASGVDWNKRTRDADLIRGPVLEQVASALGLEVDRALALTVHPYLARLPEQDRGSLRWWIISTSERIRMCDRCVADEAYGRIHWRLPVITECLKHRRPLLDECRLCGAARSRDTRRWERFDCGHHVRSTAGDDSRSVDLRVQRAIQSALGLGPGQPTEANAWIVHAALAQRAQLGQVQVAREILHELRMERRAERILWQKAARMLGAREDKGERMYPTERAPLFSTPPTAEAALSPMDLKLTMERIWQDYSRRSASDPSTTVAMMTGSTIGTPSPA